MEIVITNKKNDCSTVKYLGKAFKHNSIQCTKESTVFQFYQSRKNQIVVNAWIKPFPYSTYWNKPRETRIKNQVIAYKTSQSVDCSRFGLNKIVLILPNLKPADLKQIIRETLWSALVIEPWSRYVAR